MKFIKKLLKFYFLFTGILLHLGVAFGIYLVFYQYDIPYGYFAAKIHPKISPFSYRLADFIAPLPKKEEWKSPFPATLDWTGQGANTKYNAQKTQYNSRGVPLNYQSSSASFSGKIHKAYTPEDILRLLKTVKAGESIEIQPGIYYLDSKRIPITTRATQDQPITVYAKKLGNVFLKLNTQEGFNVTVPYWSFQNLIIQGNCSSHTTCEHAFHIVGGSNATIIRNNIISDFNAAIKGNGIPSKNNIIDKPNHVLIEHNSFTFSTPRNTSNAVTPIDVVGGDGWRIKGNLISDFIKSAGDNVSYAAVLKGGGTNGIMEQNMVICSKNLYAGTVRQIGLSLGGNGGGSNYEHKNGIVRNNIIMNCNDVGIYINKAPKTTITHNTLYNTVGIDVRFAASDASITNNLMSGRIKSRDNAQITQDNNQEKLSISEFQEDWFHSPQTANFIAKKQSIPMIQNNTESDFCGNERTKNRSSIGAIDYKQLNNKNCKRLLANRLSPIDVDISQLKVMAMAKNNKAKVRNTKGKKLLDSVRVCSHGCQFSDLNQALSAVKSYGKVYIAAEKMKTCGIIHWPVTIIGESSTNKESTKKMKKAHLYGKSCKGKGAIVIESPGVTINNLRISDLNVGDGNGACIRLGPNAKNTIIKNIYCHDTQNGILGHFKQGNLYIADSVFERNGFGGRAHGMYLSVPKGSIHINRTKILSAKGSGHSLKISAPNMLIENSVLAALNGHNSRAIDNFGSGNLILRNNVIQQGANSENNDMLGIALEPTRVLPGEFSIFIENNWFIFDNKKQKGWLSDSNKGRLFNNRSNNKITLKNNWIVGMHSINTGIAKSQDNQIFNTRQEAGLPEYDKTLATLPVDQ